MGWTAPPKRHQAPRRPLEAATGMSLAGSALIAVRAFSRCTVAGRGWLSPEPGERFARSSLRSRPAGMEARGSAHYWARELDRHGARGRVDAAAYIKPCQAGQERCGRRRADLRGDVAPRHAVRPINPAACREPTRARGNVWGPRLSDFIRASGSRAAQTGQTYGGRRPMRSRRQIACQPGRPHMAPADVYAMSLRYKCQVV